MGDKNYYPPEVNIPVYAVFAFVAIFLTALRFHTRIRAAASNNERAGLGIDDWLIVGAVLFLLGCTGNQIWNSILGTGGTQVSEDDMLDAGVNSRTADFIQIILERGCFLCVKLSLLFFYNRIFYIWKSFRIINVSFMILLIIWTIAFTIATFTICGKHLHVFFFHEREPAQQHCGDLGALLFMYALTAFITDIGVLALPLLYMRKLQMPGHTKAATSLVFVLGGSSILAGLIRTMWLAVAWPTGRMDWVYKEPEGSTQPLIMSTFNPTFYTMIEMALAIWAANLPPLGPLLRRMGFAKWVTAVYKHATNQYIFSEGTGHSRSRHNNNTIEEHIESKHRNARDSDVALVTIQTTTKSDETVRQPGQEAGVYNSCYH